MFKLKKSYILLFFIIFSFYLESKKFNNSYTYDNLETVIDYSRNNSNNSILAGIGTVENLSNNQDLKFSNISVIVTLDETNSVLDGNLTIDYYNNDPIDFNSIPFHIYLSGMQYKNQEGNIEILKVKSIDSSSIDLDYNVLSDQQLLWVNLTSPLETGQSTSLYIEFIATLPDGKDRAHSYGFDNNQSRVYTCTAFYPIPCVYDEYDGWNIDEYLNIGDPFYFDMAYYDLIIETDEDFVVAATGELVERSIKNEKIMYHYKPTHPVREIVFSASRYFIIETDMLDETNISCYYLPHNSGLWNYFALETAVNSLKLCNKTFGLYPYTTYNIVTSYGFFHGMEYPCQVLIAEDIEKRYPRTSDFYLEMVIAHESIHQWFSQLVGNDQIDFGHLDEGIVSWGTDFYFDYYYPSWHYFDNYWLIDIIRTYYEVNTQPNKINQSIYEFINTEMSYRYTAYQKTPLILEKLRHTINHENFIAGLQHFYTRYQFKIAVFPDLQKSFETILNQSLDWFFLPWFDNPYLPKYNFKSVDYDSNRNNITIIIEDLNEYKNIYPYAQQLPIKIYDKKGYSIYYDSHVWINGTTILNIELPVEETPYEIILDYGDEALVQLESGESTFLSYFVETSNKRQLQLVNLVEFALIPITVFLISFYVFWFMYKRKHDRFR